MRILFATDGSAGSAAAAEMLSRFSLTAGDEVEILSVCQSGAEREAESAVGQARSQLQAVPAEVSERVVPGNASKQIIDRSNEGGFDLIVMGAMGHSDIAAFFLGSVSERVLRHARCDVILARPVRWNLSRVLVAVDGMETGTEVAAGARRLPLPSAEYHLASVLPQPEAVMSVAPLVWTALSNELTTALSDASKNREDELRTLAAAFTQAGLAVKAEIARGDAASALLALADREEADITVIGSHRNEAIERFLLGSVSERVARHSHGSVCVVRLGADR